MSLNIDDFNLIKEGKATILAPKKDKVFYNHIQQFNRDLSVMATRAWLEWYKETREGAREFRVKRRKVSENGATGAAEATENGPGKNGAAEAADATGNGASEATKNGASEAAENGATLESAPHMGPPFVRILEALSATGLRAIRYAHEIPQVKKIVANDLLPDAVASINRSAQYNNVQSIVTGHQGDAIKYMGGLSESERFHAVDLDPYGTAAPFLDSAVQLVRDNGLLMVTCTDAGVLAGNGYPEKCFALYGGNNFGNTSMGLELNHEAGLRLMLGSIAASAAKYKKAVVPVLSLSIDYYFRVFVRVTTSPLQVKQLASLTLLAYHCVGCGHTVEQRLGRVAEQKFQTPRIAAIPGENCNFCHRPFHLAGPMWGGPLHDVSFIDLILEINSAESSEVYGTRERIKGMLTLAKNELQVPFYFNLNQLSSFMKAPPIPIDDFARAIGNLGFQVSLTHAKKNCVKTDAPWEKVLQIAVEWLKVSNTRLLAETVSKLESETDTAKKAKLTAKVTQLEQNIASNPNLTAGMVGSKILETVKRDCDIDFTTKNVQSETISQLRKLKMVRYQENPTKDWGPKSRPKE